MLKRLDIQNIATVDHQRVTFSNGFTAITGETGAGKSIMLKAIGLILGEKCSKDLIRSQTEFLLVEALFEIKNNNKIKNLLHTLDIEADDELVLRRKVHVNGKNSVFINGYSSNLSHLSSLAQALVDFHGQFTQFDLMKPSSHVDYLDRFSGLSHEVLEYRGGFEDLIEKQKSYNQLQQDESERNRKIDFLQFQVDEIEKAGFNAEQEKQLDQDLVLLSNAEKLIQTLSPLVSWIEEENSPLSQISTQLASLKSHALSLDSKLEPITLEIENGLITLQEATHELSTYLNQIEIDPKRLETVNEELSHLDSLKRKYGGTLNEIEKFKKNTDTELSRLRHFESNQGDLEQEIHQLKKEVRIRAEKISDIRNKNLHPFEQQITKNIAEMGLEKSEFKVDFKRIQSSADSKIGLNAKGADQIEFLITTNPGVPLKPLAKVASGGELSRIMLAIKITSPQEQLMPTMIFDEIDTGISGRVAELVGRRINRLGEMTQVICITHSPQVASKADIHLLVEKNQDQHLSQTHFSILSARERVQEIARFLGGKHISEQTILAAEEMLNTGD